YAWQPPNVNETLKAPRLPPLLLSALPSLPEQLEFDFSGRALILHDVDANIVVDYLDDALPEYTRQPPPPSPPAAAPTATANPVLAIPDARGATIFGVMGDTGSGDRAQYAVAETMLRYFIDSRRFPFVLMLGDNLYHDDYEGEFSTPYKG